MTRHPVILPLLVWLAAGCSASPEQTFTSPDAGPAREPEAPRPALSVDSLPASTTYESVPVTGTGPERGTLIVETPTESRAADIDAEGHFCIDVPLQPGINNTLWLRAMDQTGVYSEEVEVSVRQESGSGETDDDSPELRNIARFGTLRYNLSVDGGEPESLVDGDPNTQASWENNFWNDDYLVIELTESDLPIESIRVLSSEACTLSEYELLLTSEEDPAFEAESWVRFAYYSGDNLSAADQTTEIPLGVQPTARNLEIKIRGDTCGAFAGIHELKEVEVWARDLSEPVDDSSAPSCAGGSPW